MSQGSPHHSLMTMILCFFLFFIFFKFYFIFKLYNIVLVLPNIEMNPPQVYPCSPSWSLLPPPSPYPPSGSSQRTSPKHPVSCIKPGLATRFIHDIDSLNISCPMCTEFVQQIHIWDLSSLSYYSCKPITINRFPFPESYSVISDSLQPHGLYRSWNSPGQNTWVGSLSFLQRIFSTQGSNPGLPHWRQLLYQLSHREAQEYWSG